MQLRLLRYFTTLAREGHFARAADICGVTQPTLSAGIAAIENQFGKRLVIRDRRYVGLTSAGKALLPWAQQMLAAYDGMAHAVEAEKGPLSGEIRFGVIPAALPLIGPLCKMLLSSHPRMVPLVTSMTSREIERGLATYELDAGVTYLSSDPHGPILDIPIYAERYMFITALGSAYDRGDDISWDAAVVAPLCLLHQGMQNRRILNARVAALNLALSPRAIADNYVTLLTMVRSAGLCSIIPDSYLSLMKGAEWMRVLPFDAAQEPNRIGLIVPSRTPMTALAEAAVIAARAVAASGLMIEGLYQP